MKKIIIDNCSACKPINTLLEKLIDKGFEVLESKLEDYHFHQLYFKINTSIDTAKELKIEGFTEKDNFLICDCHWSRLEFVKEKNEDLFL
jgi:hypothetical protein